MHETGLRAGRALLACSAAEPARRWPGAPFDAAARDASGHRRLAESRAAGALREMEAAGALSASVFVGFPTPTSSTPACRPWSHRRRSALARRWCDELLDRAWRNGRNSLRERAARRVDRARPLARRCQTAGADRWCCSSQRQLRVWRDMDTMTVLGAILDAGLDDVAAFAIFDPAAVQRMIEAGVGAEVTLALGGKLDMPAIACAASPARSAAGPPDRDGAFATAARWPAASSRHGPSAVLDTGRVQIVVISTTSSRTTRPPHRRRNLARNTALRELKSRIHWRAGLRPLAMPSSSAPAQGLHLGLCSAEVRERAPADYRSTRCERTRRAGRQPLAPLPSGNTTRPAPPSTSAKPIQSATPGRRRPAPSRRSRRPPHGRVVSDDTVALCDSMQPVPEHVGDRGGDHDVIAERRDDARLQGRRQRLAGDPCGDARAAAPIASCQAVTTRRSPAGGQRFVTIVPLAQAPAARSGSARPRHSSDGRLRTGPASTAMPDAPSTARTRRRDRAARRAAARRALPRSSHRVVSTAARDVLVLNCANAVQTLNAAIVSAPPTRIRATRRAPAAATRRAARRHRRAAARRCEATSAA